MIQATEQATKTQELFQKIGTVLTKRCQTAQRRFAERVTQAFSDQLAKLVSQPMAPWEFWKLWPEYFTDAAERSALFWDAMRQRGDAFLERERAGKPPVLHFEYEIVLDAREFQRPVNYALVRIVPPEGVTVDPKRRPYVIIDPRAGHGPGIGGFKDDSQVGVALRAGHPVYFVIFFPEPQAGQTLPDVCAAEQRFVAKVRALHPDSAKPAIVGNCQGGWAAMMLASSSPEDTGPIVINGSPMSYWGGAWSEGEGNNPMRYAGGLLGGSSLASFMADLGHGVFDGAWLVQNFESLNPANTCWDKYYHVFANADSEPPRFLDFERWWGGFYLLNRGEIEWIVQNLFVGNKLWSDDLGSAAAQAFDLREVRSPIILFASMGDNITPPQQAFNWIADVYGSTEEIKAEGQVIIGLLHQSVGHLGIFVSGRVAKKEHSQIVSVMQSIESLPPGLYGMRIDETRGADGKPEYEVEFVEHRLEEIIPRLNRFQREDEKAFEAVSMLSEFNQRAYEMFVRPLVQAGSSEPMAQLGRALHPLRFQRWALSSLNPWLAWLGPAAASVKATRHAVPADQPFRAAERGFSEVISASLDYYRDVRDALSEAMFFATFGSMFNFYLGPAQEAGERAEPSMETRRAARDTPAVKKALASIEEGGYAAAVSRAGYLLGRKGRPLPLARLHVVHELAEEYRDLFPELEPDQRRRIRGEQEIICRYEPERALQTLPKLLADEADRRRFRTLLDQLLADPRFIPGDVTEEQLAMIDRIRLTMEDGHDRPAAASAGADTSAGLASV